MKPLEYYWYHSNVLMWFLLPLSWLYCLITIVRKKLYQSKLIKSYRSQVPIVVVGNIVVGGSGKTPLLIALCEHIKQRGFNPGVVSRGYGGNVVGVKQVQAIDTASLVGDEPLMISLRTDVPVVVGADRVAAVDSLLENNHCDIVLSDDGLQHYRMKRDVEFAVLDAKRKYGNGFCLPAGPLRERISRLDEVDAVIFNGGDADALGYSYELEIIGLTNLHTDEIKPLSALKGDAVHAVAGIGHPARFFDQLRKNNINVTEHAFPDHHHYQQDDFSGWNHDCIIMTEKDAVKCRDFDLHNAWVLLVEAKMSKALETRVDELLAPLLKHRVSG